jgi:hypothetical protein
MAKAFGKGVLTCHCAKFGVCSVRLFNGEIEVRQMYTSSPPRPEKARFSSGRHCVCARLIHTVCLACVV